MRVLGLNHSPHTPDTAAEMAGRIMRPRLRHICPSIRVILEEQQGIAPESPALSLPWRFLGGLPRAGVNGKWGYNLSAVSME